jgi:predicted DNA-binding transcriptional regulator AlpA
MEDDVAPQKYFEAQDSLLRLKQIVGDTNCNPPIPAIIPVSKSAWWAGVASGRYPRPVKLGPRTTAWRASDIARLMQREEVEQ